ncbi:MAG TPA: hypothetical protein PLP56_07100 [Candidatus Omnitrophota bacterium]|nr:hypothetical protein [Candidatus Omnitrophota bacterium]HNQ50361.1 hypothetical protein [Candidatus Omnitrophota bacterium]HQO38511.1 hypothetical protein [Candidatus Omnitrophota bacterium]HQQ06726.1 hypothetical protein [Candidatus Omnitrophota bacterium]
MTVKRAVIMSMAVAGAVLGCIAYLGATNAPSPYSSSDAGNIGAWYDELWEAAACYQTARETDTQVVFAQKDIAALPAGNPTLIYDTGTVKVSLPSRTAVTKWKVTGHVHFPNN